MTNSDGPAATCPGPCDWCDAPATVTLPDLPPIDDDEPHERDARACFAHDVEHGVGRSIPLAVIA